MTTRSMFRPSTAAAPGHRAGRGSQPGKAGVGKDAGDDSHGVLGRPGRLLSPELLGITAPEYGDFIAGNVVEEPITAMLARAGGLRYVTEFVTALNDCADRCAFYDFCRGGQAGNRYFEHHTFTVRETNFCRTTRQALVRATADHLTPTGGPA